MSEPFQVVVGGILAVLYGLSALSRQFPHVGWLRHFRIPRPQLTKEQQARMRRRANLHAGAHLILLGLVLPLGYVVLTVMTFNTVRSAVMAIVLAGSVLCIVLGIVAIVQGIRR